MSKFLPSLDITHKFFSVAVTVNEIMGWGSIFNSVDFLIKDNLAEIGQLSAH